MTQQEWEKKAQAMGGLKIQAWLANRRGEYRKRNELCKRHDDIAIEILRIRGKRCGR